MNPYHEIKITELPTVQSLDVFQVIQIDNPK